MLSNGLRWELYRIRFEQPIGYDEVCSFDVLDMNPRRAETHELLYLLCKEGLSRSALEAFHERAQVVNRFVVGSLIASDPVLAVVRRELKRLSPDSRVSIDELRDLLPDVLKRDVLEGESATHARRHVARAALRPLRKTPAEKDAPTSGGQRGLDENEGVG